MTSILPINISDIFGNYSNDSTLPEFNCNLVTHNWLEAKLILISGFGTLVTVFGIFGNLTTAIILTRPSMRSPNNLFLTALAIYDTCVLVTAFMIYSMEYIIEYLQSYHFYIAWLTYLRFMFALSHISQTGSVYTTVAVTIERFLAVVVPKYGRVVCTKHGAATAILLVTCFAIMFNCTKFFELDVLHNPNCPDGTWGLYELQPGALAMSHYYQVVYTLYLSNAVMVFLPFISLLVGNTAIALTIRRSMKKLRWAERISRHSELKEKSRDATHVLIVIVFIFLVCNFWGFVLALLERTVGQEVLYREYTKFYAFSRESINFLAIVNSSINFVIYCIFGKDFRKELVLVYGCGAGGCAVFVPEMSDTFHNWAKKVKWANQLKKGSVDGNGDSDSELGVSHFGLRKFTVNFALAAGTGRNQGNSSNGKVGKVCKQQQNGIKSRVRGKDRHKNTDFLHLGSPIPQLNSPSEFELTESNSMSMPHIGTSKARKMSNHSGSINGQLPHYGTVVSQLKLSDTTTSVNLPANTPSVDSPITSSIMALPESTIRVGIQVGNDVHFEMPEVLLHNSGQNDISAHGSVILYKMDAKRLRAVNNCSVISDAGNSDSEIDDVLYV